MPYADSNGVRLYYEEAGKGTPIVFVHEFAADLRSWEPQIRHFSRRYRCIVSMSELFELYVGALFTPGLVCAREAPRRDQACRRARDRQGRCAPLARWPEDGPSLTAAVRDGPGCVQVGAEGWCRSNKRMERECRCRHGGLPTSASGPLYSVREAEVALLLRPSFIVVG